MVKDKLSCSLFETNTVRIVPQALKLSVTGLLLNIRAAKLSDSQSSILLVNINKYKIISNLNTYNINLSYKWCIMKYQICSLSIIFYMYRKNR